MSKTLILGGGVTGLGAGWVSGLPVLEAAPNAGGICTSYYVRPGETERQYTEPSDEEAYRFETGGGHWIFGGIPVILHLFDQLVPIKRYERSSGVYFADTKTLVPYPIQNNLRFLEEELKEKIVKEVCQDTHESRTMGEWFLHHFGPTLNDLFFSPFNELYTAGLVNHIAPQDAQKSPISRLKVLEGAYHEAKPVGYNVTYGYPEKGLNSLVEKFVEGCDIRFNKRAIKIDVDHKVVIFEDGSEEEYESLISTIPLNRIIELTQLEISEEQDPYTSVLVLNIGAKRGKACPNEHWLYLPKTESAFHRVGFYSNVDTSFLPKSSRDHNDCVSIYVEKAYVGGRKPSDEEVQSFSESVVKELQSWDFIGDVDVLDPTWIDVAYTWSYPNSTWKKSAIEALREKDIFTIGRYGQWKFQGIADSFRDGFIAGGSFKPFNVRQL